MPTLSRPLSLLSTTLPTAALRSSFCTASTRTTAAHQYRSLSSSSSSSTNRPGTTRLEQLRSSKRTMASTSAAAGGEAQKHEWMVILPDVEGALERRMAVRGSHLSAITPLAESGFWVLGGASLSEPITAGQPPKITGSVMMAVAATKDEVLAKLREDIYFKEGVWDWEKVQIFPFKSAIRSAL